MACDTSEPSQEAGPRRPSPVFLHAGYRTGSTWLWQKMRQAPTTLAYYEVFHECLATIVPAAARRIDFTSWDSRHPVSTPYFLEFLPLISPQGGVTGFDASMSFENFVPRDGPDGELRPAEKTYIDRLLTQARANKKIPVLSCARSLGRARALRHQMGGHAVLLHRNMFHQWASFCWQAELGNEAFFDSILRIVVSATHDPFLSNLADWFGLHQARPRQEDMFQVFIIAHLYFYTIAFDACDVIVDLDEVATDRAIRRRIEERLSEIVASQIDLSDARQHCEFTALAVDSPQRVKDTIEQFSKLIPGGSRSEKADAFVRRIQDRALTEWDRFEFFNKRTRTVFAGKIEDAAKRLEDEIAKCEALVLANERLSQELAGFARLREVERGGRAEAFRQLTVEATSSRSD